uniref:Uncharacterized protein n=1 Tax=Kryptolebias marmoratus TaxID=37003 RepID=A0A3Q3A1L0_KRYMA
MKRRTMSAEVDSLLQEAKESIEAAQNYRSELQQRLHGLNQARKQVGSDLLCAAGWGTRRTNWAASPTRPCTSSWTGRTWTAWIET